MKTAEARQLQGDPAFNTYLGKLRELFALKYKGLRNCRKSDASYNRINGYLDGLEKAINLIDETIDENQEE